MPRPPVSLKMLVIAVMTVTIATQPVFLLAAASPQAGPELGFGPIGLGLYTTAFFLAASVASTPAGRMVERIGWPRAMRLTMVGAITTLLSIAAFAHTPGVLAILLVVAAGFYGFANPAANLALARFVRPGAHGTFFGLKHAGIPGSTLLAGLTVPLINLTFGWRWSYVAAASVGAVVLLIVPSVAPEPQRAAPATSNGTMTRSDLRRLTGMAALATSAPGALATFTVSAGLAAGLSEAAAGWTLSVAGLATIAARGLYGIWLDRSGRPVAPLLLGVVGVGSVAIIGLSFGTGAAFVAAAVVAFTTAWGWPGMLTLAVVKGNPENPAEATARSQAGIFVGAGLSPPLFGWIVDQWGFRPAWMAISVTLALGVVIALPWARRAG